MDSRFARYQRFLSVLLGSRNPCEDYAKDSDMPLRRLSDIKRTDGMVSIGSMSKRIKVDDREVWARVSRLGRKAEVTFNYMPDLKMGTLVDYEDQRFRVERVVELGLREQIRLECSVA